MAELIDGDLENRDTFIKNAKKAYENAFVISKVYF